MAPRETYIEDMKRIEAAEHGKPSTRYPNGNPSDSTLRYYEVKWTVPSPVDGSMIDAQESFCSVGWLNGKPYTTVADLPKIVTMRTNWGPDDIEIYNIRLIGYGH